MGRGRVSVDLLGLQPLTRALGYLLFPAGAGTDLVQELLEAGLLEERTTVDRPEERRQGHKNLITTSQRNKLYNLYSSRLGMSDDEIKEFYQSKTGKSSSAEFSPEDSLLLKSEVGGLLKRKELGSQK